MMCHTIIHYPTLFFSSFECTEYRDMRAILCCDIFVHFLGANL